MAQFDLELSSALLRLSRQLENTQEAFDVGARKGMEKAVELWEAESKEKAPMDKRPGSNAELRDSITGEVVGHQVRTIQGTLTANAYSNRGRSSRWKPFNYAYYLHEVYPRSSFANPSQAGTVPKFLDAPLEDAQFKQKLLDKIEHAILDEVERRGW